MRSVLKDFRKVFEGFCPFSKYILRYGTVLILTLLAYAFFCYMQSRHSIYYAVLLDDVLFTVKECMGSIYILPMLFEAISMIVKRN